MKSSRSVQRESAGLWRWLLGVLGTAVFLVLGGFLVPASDEQVHSAAIQHVLRSRIGYPTTAYVWTEADLASEVREQLTAFASDWNVYLLWESEFSSLPPDFVESVEDYVRVSFGLPDRGFGFTRLRAGVSSGVGGRVSEIVFFHWMGICEVWKEVPGNDY